MTESEVVGNGVNFAENMFASSTSDPELNIGDYVAYDQRPETYIVPLVFGIIFLAGLIGNGCLICIFCREPSVRSSVPNTFILNLALGDLLVLFCSVPFTSTIYTFESWPYGEFVCKASEYAKVRTLTHYIREINCEYVVKQIFRDLLA